MIRSIIRPETWVSCGYDGAYYWLHKSAYTEVGVTGGHEYRTRIAFKAPRMSLGGGKNVTVSQAVLRLTSVTDASNTLTAQSTYGANWGFPETWATYPVTITGNATTETDVTPPAEIAETFGSWHDYVYYHLSYVAGGDDTWVRLASYDTATPPELIVTWDYAENTMHTDATYAYTGGTTRFTITPTADDDRYVLTWQMGGATGTVADVEQRSYPYDTTINWIPSAADFGPAMPDTREAPVALTLTVYDGSGNVVRTENTSLQMIIADTYDRPTIADWGLAYDVQVADTYNLVGVTEATIAPVVQLTNPAGSSVSKLTISAYPNQNVLLEWSAGELTDNGDHTYTATRKSLGILQAQADNLTAHVTNARGISRTIDHDTGLEAYDYARPSISLFSAERYGEIIDDDQHVIGYQTDPTGNKVWFSASAAIASVGGANVMNWVLTLTSRADGTVLTASGTATGTSLVWSDDRTLIGDTIDPEIVWDAALTITDSAGFTATAYDVVPAGKAVLHLPACKNGIAFGGLSTATSENPLGEMFYPFHAYAGIYGVTGWSLKEEDTGGVWLDGQKVYRKTLYARIATAGQAVDIPFPDGLQRIVHMQGILYTDDTINRTRPLSWYYNASLNASLWHGGSANVTVQANGEIGDAFVTIWYTKTAGIVITQQPEDATVALGGTATFNVAALGSPTYQWQQSTPPTASVGPDELLHVTDALNAPVTALEAAVAPVQSGSGDPSPTNIRPITGWTGAKVFVSDEEPVLGEGRNLLAISDMTISLPLTQHAINYTNGGDGWVNAASSAISTTGNFITTFWGYNTETAYIGAGTYTLTIEDDSVLSAEENATIRVQVYGSGLSGDGTGGTSGRYFQTAGTYSLIVSGYIQRIGLYYLGGTNGKALDGRIRIKLERGETSSGWSLAPEDYTPTTTVAFPEPTAPRNMIINTNVPDVSSASYCPRLLNQKLNTRILAGTVEVATATHGMLLTSTQNKGYLNIYFGGNRDDVASRNMNGLVAGETYTFSFDYELKMFSDGTSSAGYYFRFYEYEWDETRSTSWIQNLRVNLLTVTPSMYGQVQTGHADCTFTIAPTSTGVNITLGESAAMNGIGDYLKVMNLMLIKGSTPAAYTPAPEDVGGYTGTVYGGTLDATGGTLTVTQQVDTFDGSSDESWTLQTWSYSRRYFRVTLSKSYQNVNHGIIGVSANWLPAISDAQDGSYTLSSLRLRSSSTASNYLFLLLGTDIPNVTTVAELRAYLAENPLQVSYPVATPSTVSLTPATVQLLSGENFVWADTGDASMTYYTTGTPTWSDISGETANALSVTASLEAAQRQYRCALTEGSAEAVSDAAGIVIQ